MEWLKGILGEVENSDELVDKIKKELPKHFKPSAEFNEKNDKVKTLTDEVATYQSKLEELSNSTQTVEELKQALTEEKTRSSQVEEKYRLQSELRSKKDDLTRILTNNEYNVDKTLLSLILSNVEYDKITISDGKCIGTEDIAKGIRVQYPTAFEKVTTQGTPPGSGIKDDPLKNKNPWMKETRNLTEQGKLIRDDPQKARQLASVAGVDLKI